MSGPILFGVRHLSPAAAFRVRKALDEAQPELVLVEGPSDLNGQMEWLCHPETEFPAAILAYTKTPPVHTVLWPFAIYSPEVQAILWAHEHEVECRFMDLPSSVFLALREGEEVSVERDERRRRISQRLQDRLKAGMADEVRSLLDSGIAPDDLIYYGLEYKFLTLYVLGRISRAEMENSLEIAIHQFAKRQMTWFRGMERRGHHINWIDAGDPYFLTKSLKLIEENDSK